MAGCIGIQDNLYYRNQFVATVETLNRPEDLPKEKSLEQLMVQRVWVSGQARGANALKIANFLEPRSDSCTWLLCQNKAV